MFDDVFERPHRRKIDELNVVPILDMLMSVIFFLLLSTTLVGYTKLEIPPAKISQETESSSIPLTPKLIIQEKNKSYEFKLKWTGQNPSQLVEILKKEDSLIEKEFEKKIRTVAAKIATDFLAIYPEEKTLQVGLAEKVHYQILISVMDGLKSKVKDVVLFSYADIKGEEKE